MSSCKVTCRVVKRQRPVADSRAWQRYHHAGTSVSQSLRHQHSDLALTSAPQTPLPQCMTGMDGNHSDHQQVPVSDHPHHTLNSATILQKLFLLIYNEAYLVATDVQLIDKNWFLTYLQCLHFLVEHDY